MIKGNLYSEYSIVNWTLHHLINKTHEKSMKFLKENKSGIYRIDGNGSNKGKDLNNFMTE